MSEERRKKSCKFLGVYLDPLLTWHSHVDALSKNIFALRVLFFSLSSVVLRSIYFALVEHISDMGYWFGAAVHVPVEFLDSRDVRSEFWGAGIL